MAEPSYEPEVKKQKLEKENEGQEKIDADDVFATFHSKYGEANMHYLCNVYEKLFQREAAFKAVQIKNSNCTSGSAFTNAYIDVKEYTKKLYLIGPIFESGLKYLHRFLHLKEIPEEPKRRQVLASLLTYFLDKDIKESLGSVPVAKFCQNEHDVTLLVLNHLLLPLTPPTKCIVDCHTRWKFVCPDKCKNKALEMIESSDTSIGHSDVWHGRVDAMIGKPIRGAAISVAALHEDNGDSGSPGFRSCIEVKKSFVDPDIPAPQIISQAIVFSFLQRNLHPENKNTLIPTIGISAKELVVYFYDCENDILLQSVGGFGFQESGEKRIITILIAWLVVNYKYLCDGLVETLKSAPKANFFDLCKEKIEVYKNAILHGGVGKGETSKTSYFKYADATWDIPSSSDEIRKLEPYQEK